MAIFAAMPFTLTNGQTADATQVMSNFNQIITNGNAGAAALGANSDITSLSALTTALTVGQGGSGVKVAFQGPAGAMRNLKIVQATATTATVTYDEVLVKAALGGLTYCLNSGSFTFNTTTTGTNGMDTGAAPSGADLSLYLAYNPTTANAAVVGTLGSTSNGTVYSGASLPSGYTATALIASIKTTAASQLPKFIQMDRCMSIAPSLIVTGTSSAGFITVAASSTFPANARMATGYVIAPASTTLTLAAGTSNEGLMVFGGGVGTPAAPYRDMPLMTAQTLFYTAGASGAAINVTGWQF